ncbi:MHYT domain-containing protein [Oleiharenicola lentus]|uniref:MHYT domain-containing protein n=1 Tax=Oleiharenicola lentus TaxID=2508720 RepID=UPI0013E91AB4|nr:MHYT domain-containing protein [Oleiharenicola lentus]
MQAAYSQWIVVLSYVIAVIASYVALDMASRVSASRGTKVARYWMAGGAIAMGAGIWSMHFVGMLAMSLPIEIPYNIPITFLSLVFAIAASGVALFTISRGEIRPRRLLTAGVVMGGGVALMHYTGMVALEISPRPTYEPVLFTVSILIAIAASVAAMWICFQLKSDTIATAFWKKSASALVMGVAIWGMHFTAMAAAVFDANTVCGAAADTIDNKWLATTVGLCTFFFLAATMLISLVDAKMTEHRTNLEAQSERLFNQSLNLICSCAPDGRFQRLNPAGWAILGYSCDVLPRLTFMEIIEAQDRPAVQAAINSLASGKPALSVEARCHSADGTAKALLWNLTLSADRSGFYVIGHDLTERKQAEEELARTYQRLIEVSRQAGMAEVATGVLHNVGNVLNSVNVSASLASEIARRSRIDQLEKLCGLLEARRSDLGQYLTTDPQGRLVPDFLRALADGFTKERSTLLGELENLRKSIEHIRNIVAMQQSHAKSVGVTETLPLTDLIESALRINADILARRNIELVRDYQATPTVMIDKHKVMQILINLIRNACHACDETGRTDKRISVQTTGEKTRCRITVTDNGVGIPAENLARIFNHGFTTRKDGHGFGLHTGALAAKELGGTLQVTSDGAGRGASFTLEIPCATPASSAQAA